MNLASYHTLTVDKKPSCYGILGQKTQVCQNTKTPEGGSSTWNSRGLQTVKNKLTLEFSFTFLPHPAVYQQQLGSHLALTEFHLEDLSELSRIALP